ncbi:MAG: hypothetical protein QME75_11520 [Deltaproteobacteria bacterium]|nr:hypothetical protein [Deltaproteobacteria bacterium]
MTDNLHCIQGFEIASKKSPTLKDSLSCLAGLADQAQAFFSDFKKYLWNIE